MKSEAQYLPSLVSVPRRIPPHLNPPTPTPPPVQNEKSVIFITKYYLHSILEDRILFRGDGIRHLFSDFIPTLNFFPSSPLPSLSPPPSSSSTSDKIIARSIRIFGPPTRLTYIFARGSIFFSLASKPTRAEHRGLQLTQT